MPKTKIKRNPQSDLLEEFISAALLKNGSRVCNVAGAQVKIYQPEYVQGPLEEDPLGALEVISIKGDPYNLISAIMCIQTYRPRFNDEAKRFELYKV